MFLAQTKISESSWSVPVASLFLVAMLVAFYAVVSNAAKAGELRRHATATLVTAVAQCHALPSRDASRTCLELLDARQPADEPTPLASK